MYATIRLIQPGKTELTVIVEDPLVIGRNCEGLSVHDEAMSRRHLEFKITEARLVISDLNSTNGTYVDGHRVSQSVFINEGQTVRAGMCEIVAGPVFAGSSFGVPNSNAKAANPTSYGARSSGDSKAATASTSPEHSTSGAGTAPPPAPPAPSVTEAKPFLDTEPPRHTAIDRMVLDLGSEIAALRPANQQGTLTIVFSDIESSTDLALSMGDRNWVEILTQHNKIVAACVRRHSGTIIKNQGDGFMISFNSSRQAIIACCEIQNRLYEWSVESPNDAVRVRIGAHTGEAIRDSDGDLFGRHVIIAARVGAAAKGGEILVSSLTKEIAAARGDLYFGEPKTPELKGLGKQTVYPVLWGAPLPES